MATGTSRQKRKPTKNCARSDVTVVCVTVTSVRRPAGEPEDGETHVVTRPGKTLTRTLRNVDTAASFLLVAYSMMDLSDTHTLDVVGTAAVAAHLAAVEDHCCCPCCTQRISSVPCQFVEGDACVEKPSSLSFL
jgi:hypothetical protein